MRDFIYSRLEIEWALDLLTYPRGILVFVSCSLSSRLDGFEIMIQERRPQACSTVSSTEVPLYPSHDDSTVQGRAFEGQAVRRKMH